MFSEQIIFHYRARDVSFCREVLSKTFSKLNDILIDQFYNVEDSEFYEDCCRLFKDDFLDSNRALYAAWTLGADPLFIRSIIDSSGIILKQNYYPQWINTMITVNDYVLFISPDDIYTVIRSNQCIYFDKFNDIYATNVTTIKSRRRYIDFLKFVEGEQITSTLEDLVVFGAFGAELGANNFFCEILSKHLVNNKFDMQYLKFEMIKDLDIITPEAKQVIIKTINKYNTLENNSEPDVLLDYLLTVDDIYQEVIANIEKFNNKEIDDLNVTIRNSFEFRKIYEQDPNSELGKYIGIKLTKLNNKFKYS